MVALHRVCVHIHRPKTPVAPIGTNRRVPNRVSACMIDVAIVGAGPAGLCTAAALTRGSANPSAIQVGFMITQRRNDCVCFTLAPPPVASSQKTRCDECTQKADCTWSPGKHLSRLLCCLLQVFDHIQKFDVCGAGLALRSNGFAALNAIDSSLLQNIAALTYQPERVVMHSLDGRRHMKVCKFLNSCL